MDVHDCAMAYKKNFPSPLKNNALKHKNYSYTLRLDFKEFFPSIKPLDLINKINEHKNIKNSMTFNEDDIEFIKHALFVLHPQFGIGLAIGAPSSPIVSNIVMYNYDEILETYSVKHKGVYSRYADDIYYSSNTKGSLQKFMEHVIKVLDKIKSPKLELNNDKTNFMSRANRRVVTGLFITPDKKISLGRHNKRYIRKLVFEYTNKKINDKKIKYLQGYLAYALDCDSKFINRIIIKYGADTISEILKFPFKE